MFDHLERDDNLKRPRRKGKRGDISLHEADAVGLILGAHLNQRTERVVEGDDVLSAAGQPGRSIGEAATGVKNALLTDQRFGETVTSQMLVHQNPGRSDLG